ncbi:MAG: peptide chain release factor N(5)-glutamine methyltransferase, partial [Armatimonadota bacterium]
MPYLVGQAVNDATVALGRAGVEAPQREALALVAWALDTSTAAVLAHPERALRAEQEQLLRHAVRRRGAHEPLAYVTGRAEFYGLEFAVDPRVMVPRPETEHVVEHALAAARGFDEPLIADVGTGSGCIAVALACSLERAIVYATDSSRDALEVAETNARRHNVQDRVRLLHGDLLDPLSDPVHVIAANPPYVA